MKILTTLTNALRLLEERGWCQGRSKDYNGRMCIQGALLAAHVGAENMGDMTEFMFAETRTVYDETTDFLKWYLAVRSIPEFNDRPGRRWGVVRMLLEEAIEYLESLKDEEELREAMRFTNKVIAPIQQQQLALDAEMLMQLPGDIQKIP